MRLLLVFLTETLASNLFVEFPSHAHFFLQKQIPWHASFLLAVLQEWLNQIPDVQAALHLVQVREAEPVL